jgi:hypothetical protein
MEFIRDARSRCRYDGIVLGPSVSAYVRRTATKILARPKMKIPSPIATKPGSSCRNGRYSALCSTSSTFIVGIGAAVGAATSIASPFPAVGNESIYDPASTFGGALESGILKEYMIKMRALPGKGDTCSQAVIASGQRAHEELAYLKAKWQSGNVGCRNSNTSWGYARTVRRVS